MVYFMEMNGAALIGALFWLLLSCSSSYGIQSNIDCLKALKKSVEDPLNNLSPTWNFNNVTEGFICKFAGIECWHPDETKVLNIHLSDMGLKGEFPRALQNCSALTVLDLSNNNLSGTIPPNISKIVQFVTSLNLASNKFSGEIPNNLAKCSYLNILKLDNNQLTGQIPAELGLLSRIKTFNVANNNLSGPVPVFKNASISAEDYARNPGLCGAPLSPCQAPSKKTQPGVIIGAAVGGVTIAALGVSIGMFFLHRVSKKKKENNPGGNKRAKSIKGTKGIKLSMFDNLVSKMRLGDLTKAANNFSKDHIIGSGRAGTVYRAVLEDGTSLMVKKLQDTQHPYKEFMSEMATLGTVKHHNLVPLLGFAWLRRRGFWFISTCQMVPSMIVHIL